MQASQRASTSMDDMDNFTNNIYTAEERQASTVYQRKRPKLDSIDNSTNVKQRTSEMNGLPIVCSQYSNMQSFCYLNNSLKFVFSFLNMKDLFTVTRVCFAWRCIAKDSCLWQNVRLENVLISNWEKCIDFINTQNTMALDTVGMLMPTAVEDFDIFWSNFSKAIPNATTLEILKLNKCPIRVVHCVICNLPKLRKLNATLIKNAYVPEDAKIINELISFNMDYVSNMINLSELKINGETGIQLMISVEVKCLQLTKLKTLSLTSIESFPNNIFTVLGTISTNLEVLEIGDCEYLPDDFPVFLNKLINLKLLRLENFKEKGETFIKKSFEAIRSLRKLIKLELINIEFSDCVEQQLEKCDGIKSLLIIPDYSSAAATTNRHLLDCLEKLSKTLTHVVWGLTKTLLRITDNYINKYLHKLNLGYSIDMSEIRNRNNIPILRSRNPPPEDFLHKNIDILSVPSLRSRLDSMMVNAKTKVVKISSSATTQTYLSEQFD